MSYQAERDYEVTIDEVNLIKSAKKGTPGIEFRLVHADHGNIYHTMYLTEGTKSYVAKTMQEFGFSVEDIKHSGFWSGLGDQLNGKTAYITTEINEFNGRTSVRVKWFNGVEHKREKKEIPEGVVGDITSLMADLEGEIPF